MLTVSRPLLFHPLPDPMESEFGYGLRLAEENRLSGVAELFACFGMTPAAASALGVSAIYDLASGGRLLSADEVVDARSQARKLFRRLPVFAGGSPFCPRCLVDHRRWKAEWDLPLAIGCIEHGLQLVEKCERCDAQIDYRSRSALLQCKCGQDLRFARATKAPAWMSTFNSVFRPWIVQNPSLSNIQRLRLERDSLIALKRLLWLVGPAETSPSTSPIPSRRRLSVQDFATIEHLLMNWPAGANEVLVGRMSAMTKASLDKFVETVRMFAPPTVRTLVVDLRNRLSQVRRTRRSIRKKHHGEPPASGLVSLNAVRRAMGVAPGAMVSMFEQNLLMRATLALDSRDRWVSEEELHFAFWLRRTMPRLDEAAQFLGCSRPFLRALLREEMLPVVADRRMPSLPRVRVVDMANFVGALAKRAEEARPNDEYVRLTDIYISEAPHHRKWRELIQKVLSGEERLFCLGEETRGVANFAVERSIAMNAASRKCQERRVPGAGLRRVRRSPVPPNRRLRRLI